VGSKKQKPKSSEQGPKLLGQSLMAQQFPDHKPVGGESSPRNTSKPSTKKSIAAPKPQTAKSNRRIWLWAMCIFAICILCALLVLFGNQLLGGIETSSIQAWFLAHAAEWNAVLIVIIAMLGLVIAQWLYQYTVPFSIFQELTEHDNPAVGLYVAGFFLGLTLALLGSLSGLEKLPIPAMLNVGLALVIAIPLMRLASWMHDHWLLYQFSIVKELCQDRNLGTGAVCFGAFVGTGLILQSSFIGESSDWASFLISICGAFFLGQMMFLIGGFLFQKMANYDFHAEIGQRDNVSAGIMLGSFLIGIGLVVSASIININVTKHFPIGIAYANDLTEKDLSRIRPIFEEQKYFLSSQSAIMVQENAWVIQDQASQQSYLVTKTSQGLDVSIHKTPAEILRQLGYALIIGILSIFLLLAVGKLSSRLLFPRIALADEVRQKNPAIALVIATVYIMVGLIIAQCYGSLFSSI